MFDVSEVIKNCQSIEVINNIKCAETFDLFFSLLLKPPIVELETVNICNAKCVFCMYKMAKLKPMKMPDALFERVVHQISLSNIKQLCLTPMLGDPLLDNSVAHRANKLKQSCKYDELRLVTNGLAFDLHSDDTLTLLLSSVDRLQISLAPNGEVYYQMFGVDRFEHLLIQLNRLDTIIKTYNLRPRQLIINGRACGDDFHVDSRLNDVISRLCGNIEIKWLRQYKDWGGQINSLPLSTVVNKENRQGMCISPCNFSLSPHIYCDGKVGLCACAGADNSLIIGDLSINSWQEILTSDHRINLILSFLNGTMPHYCSQCSFYSPSTQLDWTDISAAIK